MAETKIGDLLTRDQIYDIIKEAKGFINHMRNMKDEKEIKRWKVIIHNRCDSYSCKHNGCESVVFAATLSFYSLVINRSSITSNDVSTKRMIDEISELDVNTAYFTFNVTDNIHYKDFIIELKIEEVPAA